MLYNFVATDKPSLFAEKISQDFDSDKGVFTDAYDWIIDKGPNFVAGLCSHFLGEEAGELWTALTG